MAISKVVLLEKNCVDKKIKGDMYFVRVNSILGLLQKVCPYKINNFFEHNFLCFLYFFNLDFF